MSNLFSFFSFFLFLPFVETNILQKLKPRCSCLILPLGALQGAISVKFLFLFMIGLHQSHINEILVSYFLKDSIAFVLGDENLVVTNYVVASMSFIFC